MDACADPEEGILKPRAHRPPTLGVGRNGTRADARAVRPRHGQLLLGSVIQTPGLGRTWSWLVAVVSVIVSDATGLRRHLRVPFSPTSRTVASGSPGRR